jgi:hypothetical protein
MKAILKRIREDRGDVLMEYVILCSAVLFPLVVLEVQLFNPAGAVSGDLGFFGQQFANWYQRILCGIALPIP